MTSESRSVQEFALALFERRRPAMDLTVSRRLDAIRTSSEWKMLGTFTVLDAIKADDLLPDEVRDAIVLAEQGEFEESSAFILGRLTEPQ